MAKSLNGKKVEEKERLFAFLANENGHYRGIRGIAKRDKVYLRALDKANLLYEIRERKGDRNFVELWGRDADSDRFFDTLNSVFPAEKSRRKY